MSTSRAPFGAVSPFSPPVPTAPIGTAASALVLLASGCAAPSPPDGAGGPAEVLFAESPPVWFDAYFTALEVAADGSRALFDGRRLVDLRAGEEVAPGGGLGAVSFGTFDADGRPVLMGRRGGEPGWFRVGDPAGEAERLEVPPPGVEAAWSPSGREIAWWSGAGSTVSVGTSDRGAEPSVHRLPGSPAAVAWTGSGLLVLVPDERGVGSLVELDPGSGEVRTVAEELDIPWRRSAIAASDDGSVAYLALAGAGAPDPEVRHDPLADRDLDIWEVDLGSGNRRPVVATDAEELAPAVAGGALHWVSIETRMDAVVVPVEGGEVSFVVEGVQLPTWRPDGRALGVTFGGWRLADWALNLDGGLVEIDGEGRPSSGITPIVTGYHEDFSPVWSPDGSWIAYHSHRSPTPVASYGGEGSADDIYVRRPGAPTAEEVRLTDFGREVGSPDWAPDGRRIVLTSWDEGGGASAWIVEMDPRNGAALGRVRVPAPDGATGSPSWAAWSPVRDELAIVFATPGGAEAELWILAPDGGSARRVSAYPSYVYAGADWSADGESLVYSALVDDHLQLFSIPRSGGVPLQLTDGGANLMHPQVSPDGDRVVATRILHERRILRRPR